MLNDRDRFVLQQLKKCSLSAQMVKDISWIHRARGGERQPFTSIQNAQRRLKQLTASRFITHQELDCFEKTFFYRLTKRGAREVFTPDEYDREKNSKAYFASCRVSNEEHNVALSHVFVKLTLDADRAGIPFVLYIRDGNFNYRLRIDGKRRKLTPDGSVILFENGIPKLFFLEMDMGRESSTVFAEKILKYSRLAEECPTLDFRPLPYRPRGFRVLVIAKGGERLKNLLALARKAGKRKGAFYFLKFDQILRDERSPQTYTETNVLLSPVFTRHQGTTALCEPLGSPGQTVYNTEASSLRESI